MSDHTYNNTEVDCTQADLDARIVEAQRAKYGTCSIDGCDEPCVCPRDTVCYEHRDQGIYIGLVDVAKYYRGVAIDRFASRLLLTASGLPLMAATGYFLLGVCGQFRTTMFGYTVALFGGVVLAAWGWTLAEVLWAYANRLKRQAKAPGRR